MLAIASALAIVLASKVRWHLLPLAPPLVAFVVICALSAAKGSAIMWLVPLAPLAVLFTVLRPGRLERRATADPRRRATPPADRGRDRSRRRGLDPGRVRRPRRSAPDRAGRDDRAGHRPDRGDDRPPPARSADRGVRRPRHRRLDGAPGPMAHRDARHVRRATLDSDAHPASDRPAAGARPAGRHQRRDRVRIRRRRVRTAAGHPDPDRRRRPDRPGAHGRPARRPPCRRPRRAGHRARGTRARRGSATPRSGSAPVDEISAGFTESGEQPRRRRNRARAARSDRGGAARRLLARSRRTGRRHAAGADPALPHRDPPRQRRAVRHRVRVAGAVARCQRPGRDRLRGSPGGARRPHRAAIRSRPDLAGGRGSRAAAGSRSIPVPAAEAADERRTRRHRRRRRHPPPSSHRSHRWRAPTTTTSTPPTDPESSDAGTWSTFTRWVVRSAFGLAIVLVPVFVVTSTIVALKVRRRRRRLAITDERQRVRAMWAVATDALVDAGLTIAPAWTDRQIAAARSASSPRRPSTSSSDSGRCRAPPPTARRGSPIRSPADALAALGHIEQSIRSPRTQMAADPLAPEHPVVAPGDPLTRARRYVATRAFWAATSAAVARVAAQMRAAATAGRGQRRRRSSVGSWSVVVVVGGGRRGGVPVTSIVTMAVADEAGRIGDRVVERELGPGVRSLGTVTVSTRPATVTTTSDGTPVSVTVSASPSGSLADSGTARGDIGVDRRLDIGRRSAGGSPGRSRSPAPTRVRRCRRPCT